MNGEKWKILEFLERKAERWIKLWIFLALMVFSGVLSLGIRRAEAAMLQKNISREILRFHVVANSDSPQDQRIKLKVRDGILIWLEEELTETEQNNVELMKQRISQLIPDIEERSREILKENGVSYGAETKLGISRFPEKTYGDCTFPAGNYTALRITLGEAKGHNWWCVLFPRLCFMDCVHAVLPEESRQQLKNVLTEEEYESLFDPSRDEYKICFRYF